LYITSEQAPLRSMSQSPPNGRPRGAHSKRLAARLALVAVLPVCAAYWLYVFQPASESQIPPASVIAKTEATHTAAAPPASTELAQPALVTQQASLMSSIEVIVGRNDTLDRIFHRLALDKADLAQIRNLPGIRQSLDFLRPGDAIQLTHEDGSVHELQRKVSETKTLKVVREPGGFAAQMIDNPVELRTRTASAQIDSSLFQSADSAGISETLALQLAGIFAWDIDFVLDIREGDSFTVVYTQVYQDGRYLHDGDILAAQFINDGRIFRAVRFESAPGRYDYYTPEGAPLRKAFLRTPVEFTRISSRFNPRRHHPILNLIRGHMGTDYAAPTGTPVRAASDGRINFKGRKGGYGNALMVAHSRGVATLYGHLSRFAKGVSVGAHVRQGQVIGFVGMTGLATGPHLHYEYLMNGVHKDPEKVQLPAAETLRSEALLKFSLLAAPLLSQLDARPGVTAATSGAPLAAN
jgi:murein DD-endopeptidase MepM/ murein hydrolase activator NlpD